MKVIEKILYGKKPPKTSNVLWLDASESTPILKCHYYGEWVPVFYVNSKMSSEKSA